MDRLLGAVLWSVLIMCAVYTIGIGVVALVTYG